MSIIIWIFLPILKITDRYYKSIIQFFSHGTRKKKNQIKILELGNDRTDIQATNATANTSTNGIATSVKDGNGEDDKTVTAQLNGCIGCGVACNKTYVSPQGALCNSCFHHWRYWFIYVLHKKFVVCTQKFCSVDCIMYAQTHTRSTMTIEIGISVFPNSKRKLYFVNRWIFGRTIDME